MKKPELPATAAAIVEATALEYGVDVDAMFAEWPRPAEPDAARAAAITRLANEEIDGRSRYAITDLMTWFGVSRPAITRYRRRTDDYTARRRGGARPHASKKPVGADG